MRVINIYEQPFGEFVFSFTFFDDVPLYIFFMHNYVQSFDTILSSSLRIPKCIMEDKKHHNDPYFSSLKQFSPFLFVIPLQLVLNRLSWVYVCVCWAIYMCIRICVYFNLCSVILWTGYHLEVCNIKIDSSSPYYFWYDYHHYQFFDYTCGLPVQIPIDKSILLSVIYLFPIDKECFHYFSSRSEALLIFD